jgi:hypothetical protein
MDQLLPDALDEKYTLRGDLFQVHLYLDLQHLKQSGRYEYYIAIAERRGPTADGKSQWGEPGSPIALDTSADNFLPALPDETDELTRHINQLQSMNIKKRDE